MCCNISEPLQLGHAALHPLARMENNHYPKRYDAILKDG